MVVLARSHKGVEFNAMDKLPVRLFAFTLCAEGQCPKHFRTMALLTRVMFALPRDVFLQKIDVAQTAAELCDAVLERLGGGPHPTLRDYSGRQ